VVKRYGFRSTDCHKDKESIVSSIAQKTRRCTLTTSFGFSPTQRLPVDTAGKTCGGFSALCTVAQYSSRCCSLRGAASDPPVVPSIGVGSTKTVNWCANCAKVTSSVSARRAGGRSGPFSSHEVLFVHHLHRPPPEAESAHLRHQIFDRASANIRSECSQFVARWIQQQR
jgi:hypothetical protein